MIKIIKTLLLVILIWLSGQTLAATRTISRDAPVNYSHSINLGDSIDFTSTSSKIDSSCFFGCRDDIRKGEFFVKPPLLETYNRFKLKYCGLFGCSSQTISEPYTFNQVGTYNIKAVFTDKQNGTSIVSWEIIVKEPLNDPKKL